MGKNVRTRKSSERSRPSVPPAPSYSAAAQEMRALLRRVPDGLKATLGALARKSAEERERVLGELARGMGKEVLPLFRSAALSESEELSRSALRVLPVFGTRAAGDVLVEAHAARAEEELKELARQGAAALRARGVNVPLAVETAPASAEPRLQLRETLTSPPDGAGSRSIAVRMQDQFGVWHALFVLWNDERGVRDVFLRPMSRHEWHERMEHSEDRGLQWVACPPDYARWQLAAARRIGEADTDDVRQGLAKWDEILGGAPDGYEPPDPVAAVRELPEEQRRALVEESPKLFQTPEVARWFLDAADCVPWAQRWVDLQNRIRLKTDSETARTELKELIAEVQASLLTDAELQRYRGRLLDLARAAAWHGQDETARRAAAVVLSSDEGMAPAEHPFYLALVDRTLLATVAMLQRGEDPARRRPRLRR
ncbi:MAG: hypothetical protein ACK47B_08500 [Armatimonadota bacterium]